MAPSPHCTVTLKQYKGHSTRFVNIKIRALLDTGSTHSYVHRRMLPANIILEPVNFTVGNITKQEVLTVRNVINCNVVIADGDEIANCRISVIDEVDATADGILGMDLISNNSIKTSEIYIEHGTNMLKNLNQLEKEEVDADTVKTLRKTVNTATGSVNLMNTALLHPNEQLRVKVEKFDGRTRREVDSTLLRNDIVLAKPVEKANDITAVTLLNRGYASLILNAGTTILCACKTENPEKMEIERTLNFLISRNNLLPAEKITFEKEICSWKKTRNELVKAVRIDEEIVAAVQAAPVDKRKELTDILMVVRGYLSAERRNIDELYLWLSFGGLPKYNRYHHPGHRCYISAFRRKIALYLG
jgi:hypothetical protein